MTKKEVKGIQASVDLACALARAEIQLEQVRKKVKGRNKAELIKSQEKAVNLRHQDVLNNGLAAELLPYARDYESMLETRREFIDRGTVLGIFHKGVSDLSLSAVGAVLPPNYAPFEDPRLRKKFVRFRKALNSGYEYRTVDVLLELTAAMRLDLLGKGLPPVPSPFRVCGQFFFPSF